MLSVPINWPLQDDGHGWVVFQDPNGQAGGEDGSVRGGVELPGRHTDALSATFGLPNHAQPLFEQPMSTPAGAGTLFTLLRDTPPAQNLQWYEQYAVIPMGDHFLAVWLKVPEPTSGEPVPTLARMLAELRRTSTQPLKPPREPGTLAGVPATPTPAATAPTILGTSLGGIALHQTQDEIVGRLGKPQRETIAHGLGTPQWEYTNGLVVYLTSDEKHSSEVWQLIARSPYPGRTLEGFALGESEALFRQLYQQVSLQTIEHPHQVQVVDGQNTTLNVLFDQAGNATIIVLNTCLECPNRQQPTRPSGPPGPGKSP